MYTPRSRTEQTRNTDNTEGLFLRTAPIGMRCWRRGDEHPSTSVFAGLSDRRLALTNDDTSSTQMDTLSQRLSTAGGLWHHNYLLSSVTPNARNLLTIPDIINQQIGPVWQSLDSVWTFIASVPAAFTSRRLPQTVTATAQWDSAANLHTFTTWWQCIVLQTEGMTFHLLT